MPDNIDEVTKNAIRRGKTKKYQYKKVTKVAASIAVISTFNYNNYICSRVYN